MELILDGSNVLHRAHWVSKNMADNQDPKPYSEIHLFLNMMKGYMKMYPNSRVWVAWDRKIDRQIKNPRYKDLKEYKAGRTTSTVYDNCDKLIESIEYLGVHNFYPSHLEADDCIAWLTTKVSPCTIFSADNDLAQLINKTTCVYNINKKKLITRDNFHEIMKIPREIFVLHKAICGDKSDNIQGIPGYGFKRSISLAENYKNKNVSTEYRQIIEANIKLIDLVDNHYMDDLELQRYNEQFEEITDLSCSRKDIPAFESALNDMRLDKQLDKMSEWKRLVGESDLSAALKALNLTK